MFLLLLVKEGGNWLWLWATTSSLLFLLSHSLPPQHPTLVFPVCDFFDFLTQIWSLSHHRLCRDVLSPTAFFHISAFLSLSAFCLSIHMFMCVCVCAGQIEAACGSRLHNYALINNPYPARSHIIHHISAEGSDTEVNPSRIIQLLLNGSRISL